MSENTSEIIDFRGIFRKYRKNWYLFAISITGCLAIGLLFAYIRQPKYEIRASVILNEENAVGQFLGGGMSGVAQIFGGNSSASDEVDVMQSHSNLRQVALNQGLDNMLYERKMPLIYALVTKDKPILVIPDDNTVLTDTLRSSLIFKIVLADKNEAKNVSITGYGEKIFSDSHLSLPATIKTDYGTFTLMTTPYFNKESPKKYRVKITSPDIAAEDLRKENLNIEQASKSSSILELQMITKDEEYAKNILNNIIDVYNSRSNREHKQETGATARFIKDRIDAIRNSLAITENELEAYKEQAGLGMIEADGLAMYERLGETEKYLTQQQAQTEMARIALDLAKASAKDNSTIPPLTGSEALGTLINAYNTQVLQRMRLASAVKPDHKKLERVDEEITNLRSTMIKTLEDAYTSSKGMEEEIRRVLNRADGQIKQLPGMENAFRQIARTREIEEQIYIFLLQKQEEIQVLFNDNRPKVRIVDRAYSTNEDLAMSRMIILLIAISIGILIPPVILYLKDSLFANSNKAA